MGGLFKKLNSYQFMVFFWALIILIVIIFVSMVVGDAQDALDSDRKAVISEILKDYRKVTDNGTYLTVEYDGEEYRYEKVRIQEDNELADAFAKQIQSNTKLRQAKLSACRRLIEKLDKK